MDDYWVAGAAGHIDPGETARQAAAREAREDIGGTIPAHVLELVCVMQRTDGTSNPREQRADWLTSGFAATGSHGHWTRPANPAGARAQPLRSIRAGQPADGPIYDQLISGIDTTRRSVTGGGSGIDGELGRHRKFRSAVGMSIAMMCFMFTLAIPPFGDGSLKPVRIVALIGLGLALSVHIREAIKNRPH